MCPVVKRKREKFEIPSKYLLLIMTVACLGFMTLTFFTDYFGGPLNALAGYIVVPFQKGISSAGSWISTRAEELGELKIVLQENESLKNQVADLTISNTQLQQEKYELNNLRELYKLDEQYAGYEKIGARIISKDNGNWFHSFTIDKGENDGLTVDMNIIASGGLVGRIIDIGPNWSKVNAIINDNTNVSGMVLSTSDNLIVSGDLQLMADGNISFSQLIDSDNAVNVGDKIVTSSISDKYLSGILIGYISSMQTDSNNLTKSGTITPAVDFEHLNEVLIIQETKQESVE